MTGAAVMKCPECGGEMKPVHTKPATAWDGFYANCECGYKQTPEDVLAQARRVVDQFKGKRKK